MAPTNLTVQGVEIPKIGLGTWQIEGPDATEAVRDALELGYRHIDTARAYGNEAEVGSGLAEGGVEREEIFLTTKLWYTGLRPGEVRDQVESSLRDLRTDYLDLLLIHWPNAGVPLAETLDAMIGQQEEGKVRHLGVSNFPTPLLAAALEHAPILADQVEYHPYLGQPDLLGMARERDVALIAYSPFAHGGLLDEPLLREIGDRYGKTPAQVALRWLLDQPQVAAVPKASSHERRAENLDVFDFALSVDDVARIDDLERGLRTADPSWAPEWD